MLASEEGGDTDLRRFNLAADIVELVVLTGDEPFLQTLRDAVGETRRLWHVPTSDKVSDLLVAGQVGILVLDAAALHEAAALYIVQIKRQFPDLVVVVAGVRDDESSLAGLISSGTVYRFIHKPMSPARARLFADAAVKKFEEQRHRGVAAPVAVGRTPTNRGVLIGCLVGAVAVILAALWALHRGSEADSALQHAAVPVAPQAAESALLARAAAALAANRLTSPSGDNALELYLQELARYPLDAAAQAGLAEVRERLLARAENALLEERLDEAAIAIETARKAGVESGRIAFLTAQLAKSRDQAKAAQMQARAAKSEAAAVGYSSADSSGALQDLDAAVAREKFLASVVAANDLTLLKSVQPKYPQKAQMNKIEGWVELDFTVAETGEVKDVAVHGSSAPGVFDEAAIGALSQWRYRPVLRDAKPVPQRARIRIRFTLAA